MSPRTRPSPRPFPEPRPLARAIAACLHPRPATPLACAVGLALSVAGTLSQAADFAVTNTNDNGPGSLRQAVNQANNTPGPDRVVFRGVSGSIRLTTGEIAITDSVTIAGPGADVLTVDGNNRSRVFHVAGDNAETVIIAGLTVTRGNGAGIGIDYPPDRPPPIPALSVTVRDRMITGNTGEGVFAQHGRYGRHCLSQPRAQRKHREQRHLQ